MPVDATGCLALMVRLVSAGLLVQTLELLWNWRELRLGGLLGWQPAAEGEVSLRGWIGRWHGFPECLWLLVVRAVLAIGGLALPYGGGALAGVLAGLVVLQLLYNRRFTMIAGNCETMFLIGLAAGLAGAWPGVSRDLQGLALGFVAVHVALAYAVAGVNKARAPAWRDGSRLLQVLRDSSYRVPGLAARFAERPRAIRVVAWSILGLELLLPLAVFLPSPIFVALLAGGLSFHTVIAVTMGLHGFWWSFAAGYPALWFVHQWLQR